MPLRPVLKKDLSIRSHETGTKAEIEEALHWSANGTIEAQIEILDLLDLNLALDRVESGNVLGKLVLDLTKERNRSLTSSRFMAARLA